MGRDLAGLCLPSFIYAPRLEVVWAGFSFGFVPRRTTWIVRPSSPLVRLVVLCYRSFARCFLRVPIAWVSGLGSEGYTMCLAFIIVRIWACGGLGLSLVIGFIGLWGVFLVPGRLAPRWGGTPLGGAIGVLGSFSRPAPDFWRNLKMYSRKPRPSTPKYQRWCTQWLQFPYP